MIKPLSNPETLLAIAGNDNALFDELKALFLRIVPEHIKNLELTFAAQDLQTSLALLHKIKGSLQLIGADQTIANIEQLSFNASRIGSLPTERHLQTLINQLNDIVNEIARLPTSANKSSQKP